MVTLFSTFNGLHFQKSYKSTLSNYIPQDIITCGNRDPYGSTKQLSVVKNSAFKDWQDNKTDKQLNEIFQTLQNQLTVSIEYSRGNCYFCISSKPNGPLISPKTYW